MVEEHAMMSLDPGYHIFTIFEDYAHNHKPEPWGWTIRFYLNSYS